jgi:hypothetical protein
MKIPGRISKYWRFMKIQAESQNLSGKVMRNCKFMRHIIYAGTKADVEISAPDENFCAYQKIRCPQKVRRVSCAPAYYLGSAESPTADFLQVWLKSSRSSDVASRACRPQLIWRLRPLCFYGRRLSRTVPPAVPARLVKISADCQNLCARLNFQYFLWKIKNLFRLLSVLSLHRKFVHNHNRFPNSATTLSSP